MWIWRVLLPQVKSGPGHVCLMGTSQGFEGGGARLVFNSWTVLYCPPFQFGLASSTHSSWTLEDGSEVMNAYLFNSNSNLVQLSSLVGPTLLHAAHYELRPSPSPLFFVPLGPLCAQIWHSSLNIFNLKPSVDWINYQQLIRTRFPKAISVHCLLLDSELKSGFS